MTTNTDAAVIAANITAADTAEPTTLSPSGLCRFQAYDPKSPTQPKLGGRIVSLCYKGKTVDGKLVPPAHANSCIEIAMLSTDAVMAAMPTLLPHVVAYLETVQDGIAKVAHMAGSTELADEVFNIAAIVDKLESTGSGSRMSKDQLEAWFDAEVADNLMVVFAEKLGLDDSMTEADEEKLASIVAVYRARLCALAGPKTVYKPADIENLQKAINLAEATDTIFGQRLLARLAKMLEANKNAEDLLAL